MLSLIITVYSVLITTGAYLASRKAAKKYPSPFTTPVFFSTAAVITLLTFSRISYDQYQPAKEILTFLLGPATVALSVPLYKNRRILYKNLFPAFSGLIIGSLSTIITAVLLAKLLLLGELITKSLSIKSITIPVASEMAKIIGSDSIIAAAVVMITGMIGAMAGPWLLNKWHILDPFARGLSMGTIAHGIGTAEISREGELQGAVAGAAMGMAAILTSILVPVLLPILLR